ncbi:MAG: 3-deoxy-manno-octulosonate cytidylyltransferase [Bacteroidetes bacterium GWF2_38_335]|nr:MAG: 3-deoxy-manno-octulosonate cytidylyltransferase [Bacteroidetes bacterium GWF2_38_335]OFY77683.1 MAG: 3-deoxy-manno-octulosonate cytidylyltransferase [Bacteroidetes bacterium RIFOXYA12_FULL_38_20]HBS89088.1 3-deoxy-manno-octulosonate cytidylyltransferase [Bacteroidales bacterium]
MEFLGIIPARYGSTRFPGKPLADIGGKSMVRRVYEQSSKALKYVIVATDDEKIMKAVHKFGGKAVMTSKKHQSGTDRCAEALEKAEDIFKMKFDAVINIQGDEPFIQPEQLQKVISCFKKKTTQIATLAKPINKYDDIFSEKEAKMVLNNKNEVIYFSRSPIPFIVKSRQKDWVKKHLFYKHIGIYGYRADILKEITNLEQTALEKAESLEQLRWIENGYKIKVEFTEFESVSIDTPKDLKKVIELGLM